MKDIKNQEDYYAIGLKNGLIKAVTIGDYDLCIRTAAYYRRVGYSGKCITREKYLKMSEEEEKNRIQSMKFVNNL